MNTLVLNSVDLKDLENLFEKILDDRLRKLEPRSKSDTVLLTRAETAKFLRISLPTLNEWTKEGIVIGHRIGNRVLYKKVELENALTQIKSSNC